MTYSANCPCCNKMLNVVIEECGGETTATFYYPRREATITDLQAHGYETGELKRKLVFNSGIARKLIQLGNNVVDIKPLKEDPNKTAFVFIETDKFNSDLSMFSK